MKTLFAWIGRADLDARHRELVGPILDALLRRPFEAAWLLATWEEEELEPYLEWLRSKAPHVRIVSRAAPLSQPNAFTEIYRHASVAIASALEVDPDADLTFHLSPGTPIMAAVWLILGKSRYPAELVESSRGELNTVETPFNLATEVLPDLLRDPDRRLTAAHAERPGETSRFGDILYRGPEMRRAVNYARRAAPRNVPLLIEGESGTGKELLARAVHEASPRGKKPMVVVNCGAIPRDLVESRLFGHIKGAFTGAIANQSGCFEEADAGTLFLDEIGELPLPAQVSLLRVLQEGEVTRIGETKIRKVDVRVIAATNRDLFNEVVEGRFREDLLYRLAVLRIALPPLRERQEDLDLLIDGLLERINKEMAEDPLYREKSLSPSGREALHRHPWRGNIRELQNTLRRALVWSDEQALDEAEVEAALLPTRPAGRQDLLDQPLGGGFALEALLQEVSRHYIDKALAASGGNKSKAARLVGFTSYQRLDAWRARLGMDAASPSS